MKQQRILLKSLFIFLTYLFYMPIIDTILKPLSLSSVVSSFIAEIIFFIIVVIAYFKELKTGFKSWLKENSTKKKCLFILKWFVIIQVFNLLGGMISSFLFTSKEIDGNTSAIYDLFEISSFYSIFHVMIFGVIAEELVFHQSLRDILKNDVVFIVASSFLYAIMNIAYYNFSLPNLFSFIQSFLGAAIFSYIYVKNKDNIFSVMVVKFCCNLIPLILMFIGTGA